MSDDPKQPAVGFAPVLLEVPTLTLEEVQAEEAAIDRWLAAGQELRSLLRRHRRKLEATRERFTERHPILGEPGKPRLVTDSVAPAGQAKNWKQEPER